MTQYMLTLKRFEKDYIQKVYSDLPTVTKVFKRLKRRELYLYKKKYNCTDLEFISVDSGDFDFGNYSPVKFDILYVDHKLK